MASLSLFIQSATQSATAQPAAAAPVGPAMADQRPLPPPTVPNIYQALSSAARWQLGSGDERVCPAAAPAAAQPTTAIAAASRKRDAYGSAVERWNDRVDRGTIAAQITLGCKCGCVDLNANMGDILAMRQLAAKRTAAERREFIRGGADGSVVADTSARIGYAFNWGDINIPACIAGFALRHGYAETWVRAMLREMRVRVRAHSLHARRARARLMSVAGGACAPRRVAHW